MPAMSGLRRKSRCSQSEAYDAAGGSARRSRHVHADSAQQVDRGETRTRADINDRSHGRKRQDFRHHPTDMARKDLEQYTHVAIARPQGDGTVCATVVLYPVTAGAWPAARSSSTWRGIAAGHLALAAKTDNMTTSHTTRV